MSIKGKLIFILSAMGVILGSLAAFMLWNTQRITRQMESVRPAIGYLREIGSIRLRLYRQMHSLVHYHIFNEEDAIQDFEALRKEIINAFPKLRESLQARSHVKPGSKGGDAEQDLANISKVESSYNDMVKVIDDSFKLKKSGKSLEARRVINGRVEPFLDDVFLKDVDEAIADKADEIMAAYDEIILRLGAMPWVAEKNRGQIRGAQLSIRYFLAVDRLSLSLNQQLNEAVEYIVTGQKRNLQDFTEGGFEAEKAFIECKKIIQAEIGLGMEGEKGQLAGMNDLQQKYQEATKIFNRVLELKYAGKTDTAFALMEEQLRPLADELLLPKIENIMDEGREEITAAHHALLKSVYLSGILSVNAITTVAVILFLLTYRGLRRMVRAIGVLSTGTDIIGRGNLDHTISVDTNDELGGLAVSVNKMTASLKDSDDDLRSFIYGLSHDLRSPLVNIKGFSGELAQVLKEFDGLLDRASAGLPEEDRKRLQAILQNEIPATLTFIGGAAEKINELVNSVLKLARVGQMDLKPEILDMTALVRSGLGRFEEEIGRRNIAVNIDVLPAVAADRIAMQEIVANILDNAIKYLSPDRPGLVEISGQRNAGESLFHFRDNGRGIAKHDLPKIFGIFRRAGEQDISGDGIGLTYVKALVRRHGGRIWCESEAGVGTTFSFSIPDGTALSG